MAVWHFWVIPGLPPPKTKILRHVGIALNENELEKLKFLAYDIMFFFNSRELLYY
jgi:hypothetical protein